MSGEYEFRPVEEITKPIGGLVRVCIDYWWTVHPEQGVLFYRMTPKDDPRPQCNPNKVIVETMLARRDIEGLVAQQIPMAYLPHQCPPECPPEYG